MKLLESVNLAHPRPEPNDPSATTGIDKRPVTGPVQVRDPGPKTTGLGSGLVGDFIGDGRNHGGSEQAVYAFAREDLDDWQLRLGRQLSNGFFGENLTTRGLDVSNARLGERWRVGDTVELEVTCPRIPCRTFRGWMDEAAWLKTFTRVARPGAYLRVLTPGAITAGDEIEIVRRPEHSVTIALSFRALTLERELLPQLLAAGDDLIDELRESATGRATLELDTDDQP
ncbi:MAG: MOSC domain-containing protein [Jatrophihabitantaceae bacterium]